MSSTWKPLTDAYTETTHQANSTQDAYSDDEASFRVDPEVHDALVTLLSVGRPRMSTIQVKPWP